MLSCPDDFGVYRTCASINKAECLWILSICSFFDYELYSKYHLNFLFENEELVIKIILLIQIKFFYMVHPDLLEMTLLTFNAV